MLLCEKGDDVGLAGPVAHPRGSSRIQSLPDAERGPSRDLLSVGLAGGWIRN